MKELVIISGKGGTGKTSISAALAFLADKKVLADCDVDAANFHLITGYSIRQTTPFFSGFEPEINLDLCTKCGICTDLCRFNAIKSGHIASKLDCEGCGVCADHCPTNAIIMQETQAGEFYISDTNLGPLVHADLGISIENSGKLVSMVRQQAWKIANEQNLPLVITDGPPGIGCPAIAAIAGSALALAVVEPTISGIHDLIRVHQLVQHFHVPLAVCINKASLSEENCQQIDLWCKENNITLSGKIPYSSAFRQAVLAGRNVMEEQDTAVHKSIEHLWANIHNLLQ